MFGGKKKNILDAKLKDSIKKTLDKNKKCYYEVDPEHRSPAIQSHSIWKSGILKLLAKNNKVYWINPNDRFEIFGDKKELFSSVIIKNATVYRGFCNIHDDNIFKKIEKDEIYVESLIQKFLYSYRAFSYQHIQDDLSTEAYKIFEEEGRKLLNIKQLNTREFLTIQNMVKKIKERTERGKRIFNNTSKEFHNIFRLMEDNKDYTNELDEKFILKSYKINKKIECACSGIGDPLLDTKGNRIIQANTGFLFYNVFPQDEFSSYFVVGLLKSDEKCYSDILSFLDQEYKNYEFGNDNIFLLVVQNLVVNGSENIVVSPDLYLKMKKDGTLSNLAEQFEGSIASDISKQKYYQDIKKDYGYSIFS
ncbi:hypothetical protein EXW62_27365 (plasmid) [Bacillus mycoides]|uniref:hypothetical protein n=1 Tax=Bacillus mycoides TaxID=1405 RepID=UPI001C0121DD|nr:hypothetical protein [Bacillus mycoides]QWH20722.1 hypothetical protein EXW62_27365 [Bacillus mycoides]